MSGKWTVFWIVWSPSGKTPPRHRHYNRYSAVKEAERLARLHGGDEFFVLEAWGKCVKQDVVWTMSSQDDGDIPF